MKKIILSLLSCVMMQSALGYKWTVTNNWPEETRVKVVRMGTLDKDDEARAITIPKNGSGTIDLGGAYCGKGIQTKSPASSKSYSAWSPYTRNVNFGSGCNDATVTLGYEEGSKQVNFSNPTKQNSFGSSRRPGSFGM